MFKYKNITLRLLEEKYLEDLRNLRNNQSTWMFLNDIKLITKHQQIKWYQNVKKECAKSKNEPKRMKIIYYENICVC